MPFLSQWGLSLWRQLYITQLCIGVNLSVYLSLVWGSLRDFAAISFGGNLCMLGNGKICASRRWSGLEKTARHLQAASIKLIWRLNALDTLWSSWMKGSYCNNSRYWNDSANILDSGTWEILVKYRDDAQLHMRRQTGDGKQLLYGLSRGLWRGGLLMLWALTLSSTPIPSWQLALLSKMGLGVLPFLPFIMFDPVYKMSPFILVPLILGHGMLLPLVFSPLSLLGRLLDYVTRTLLSWSRIVSNRRVRHTCHVYF